MEQSNEFLARISYPTLNPIYDDIEHHILYPLSQLRELGTEWVLEFDLPLVNKKDISVSLDNNDTITVEAKLKETFDVDHLGCKSEFHFFKKSVIIPNKIDSKKIQAKFVDGILTIRIPKLTTGNKIKIE